ncbi:RimK family alpha-L-glutamate ligase [Amycolatopsis magusensis]|uniref:[lysine-biosynthesis-protein LysW]--L-2-aminoadipate ligase n=1 Tax=Amycolatopsis magusensis TaxID=882444 RepID=A0ABS4PU23_9PSEU|nr:RimK family alpha-L-glutamate ligase [Amycolatopsis magusensis]MBP2182937.1 [lysine-biosynthesis-protein LysW]--L-2-aminoadipate ligase [Amycolatopsis magusensis]
MERTAAVLTSRVHVEERLIFAAFARRGLDCVQVDPRRLPLWLGASAPDWSAVLNREISHTRASYAALTLEAMGSTVVNSAASTELCGDKWRTSLALFAAGVPTPRTALALTPEAALVTLDEMGYPAVIKPLVGSWGRLVTLVPDRQTAATVLEYVAALPSPRSHVVYAQRFVRKADRDLRVIVVGGEVLGATYRRGDGWRTNVKRGAASEPCAVTPELAELAAAAAGCVGVDIAGVDLVECPNEGLLVLEVNHRVEFASFQAAQGERVDVADRMVDHLLLRAGS